MWLVVEIGLEVARALVAACHQNLIHRDLQARQPHAGDFCGSGNEGSHGEVGEAWVKVIDSGLAEVVADARPLTGAGDFIGTPAYASSEQSCALA